MTQPPSERIMHQDPYRPGVNVSGTPWGSDVLDEPGTGVFQQPNLLQFPPRKVLLAVLRKDRSVDAVGETPFALRLEAALSDQGFSALQVSSSSSWQANRPEGYDSHATLVIAERSLKMDRTWSRKLRRRAIMLALGIPGVIAVVLGLLAVDPNLPTYVGAPLGLAFVVLLILTITAFTNVEFWSELAFIMYRPKPLEASSGLGVGSFTVRMWTGVGRSENWSTKGSSGRALKQLFASSAVGKHSPFRTA
jgi:hypothetical protein